jgi:hypothetical protein
MKCIPCCLLLTGSLLAQETPPIEKTAAATIPDLDKSVLFIEPKGRANDYVQAFELLRKDKPSTKISLRTMGGTSLNISELTSSSNGTLLFAKVPSNSGSRYLIVPIEEILEISYSSN